MAHTKSEVLEVHNNQRVKINQAKCLKGTTVLKTDSRKLKINKLIET